MVLNILYFCPTDECYFSSSQVFECLELHSNLNFLWRINLVFQLETFEGKTSKQTKKQKETPLIIPHSTINSLELVNMHFVSQHYFKPILLKSGFPLSVSVLWPTASVLPFKQNCIWHQISEALNKNILDPLWPQKKWLLSCWWKDSTGSKCLQHRKCDCYISAKIPSFIPWGNYLTNEISLFDGKGLWEFQVRFQDDFHLMELTWRDLSISLPIFQI